MKKIYTLLALFALTFLNAQVPNNGFEQTLEDGFTLKNWGAFYPIAVEINPNTGQASNNPIQFANGIGFSMPVGDCITGSWAMQITNAFNTQTNTVIPGRASIFNDAESPTHGGWNDGIMLADNAVVQFLGFDYKFFPTGNDVAVARLELFNAGSESVGVAEITISEAAFDFQYVYVPIAFTSADTPTRMTISVAMQKDGSEVNSWSSLLIDNVIVNTMMLGVRQNENSVFTIFPTMADNEINLAGNDFSGDVAISIFNTQGRKLQQNSLSLNGSAARVDVSQLAAGVYLLNAESTAGTSVMRFIKK